MKGALGRGARVAIGLFIAVFALIGLVAQDARGRRVRRQADQGAIDAVARRLPSSDLALSGGARWLRSVSLEEPGAAFADGPAAPDPDPAGGVMAPPRAAWASEVRR